MDWDDNDSEDETDILDDSTPAAFRRALHAAESGDLDRLKQLVQEDDDLVNCADCDGYTPLHRACYNNQLETVKFLLSKGAKIRAKTNDDWEPLHSAAKWAHLELSAFLLQNGADVNCSTKSGLTPLHLACEHAKKKRQIIELFLYNKDVDLIKKTENGDTAFDIARRTGPMYKLFENVNFRPALKDD